MLLSVILLDSNFCMLPLLPSYNISLVQMHTDYQELTILIFLFRIPLRSWHFAVRVFCGFSSSVLFRSQLSAGFHLGYSGNRFPTGRQQRKYDSNTRCYQFGSLLGWLWSRGYSGKLIKGTVCFRWDRLDLPCLGHLLTRFTRVGLDYRNFVNTERW